MRKQATSEIMIVYLLLIVSITQSCIPGTKDEEVPTQISISEINALSSHQRSVLNDFNLFEDFQWNGELSKLKYRLPSLENGKVVVYDETPERKGQKLETLIFENGLIIGQGKEGSITAQYDEIGNLLSFMALRFQYEDGVLVSGNNGTSNWTYEHSDDCITKSTTSRSSDFLEQKQFCWDESGHLTSLATTRNLDFSNEFHFYTYSGDQLIEKSYVETKEGDTLSYTNFKVQKLQNGLILEYTDESMALSSSIKAYTKYSNEFEVLSESPLRLKKSTLKNGEPYTTVLIEFNEDGYLCAYKEEGKYGEKYNVEYQFDAKKKTNR